MLHISLVSGCQFLRFRYAYFDQNNHRGQIDRRQKAQEWIGRGSSKERKQNLSFKQNLEFKQIKGNQNMRIKWGEGWKARVKKGKCEGTTNIKGPLKSHRETTVVEASYL